MANWIDFADPIMDELMTMEEAMPTPILGYNILLEITNSDGSVTRDRIIVPMGHHDDEEMESDCVIGQALRAGRESYPHSLSVDWIEKAEGRFTPFGLPANDRGAVWVH